MHEFTELEMRVLSELEEAGEENVTSMLNTVNEPTGDVQEVAGMRETLDNLAHLNLIRMAVDRRNGSQLIDCEKKESIEIIRGMADWLIFDQRRKLWTDSRRSGSSFIDPAVCITVTAAGREHAFQILNDRGYQWWRKKI